MPTKPGRESWSSESFRGWIAKDLFRNMRLSQGSFISLEVLKLAIPQNGGLHYIARNETIRPVRSPPQIRVFAIGGALFVSSAGKLGRGYYSGGHELPNGIHQADGGRIPALF